jgi:thymidylate kinase
MQIILMDQEKNYDPNVIMIWDRYVDSFYASNSEMTLEEANNLVIEMPSPIRTFWLDIEPLIVLTQRSETSNEHSDPEWLTIKQRRYAELMQRNPQRIIRIDGEQSIELVTIQIADEMIKTMSSK